MIVIEAIQRFVEPEPVTNPILVLVMGGCGLTGSVVGMFLFHGKKKPYYFIILR